MFPLRQQYCQHHISGCYFGEYQKQAWVFVGEIANIGSQEIESGDKDQN